ncbi:MAG: hypothetical protein WBE37_14845 [Bryobacteraceae bacterium]
MPCQLAKLLGAMRHPPARADIMDEVSERAGTLLVRLNRGSAMQVRLQPDSGSVLIRTVPIAKVTQLAGDSPWQTASDFQLRTWIESGSAVWQWLLAQGVDSDRIVKRLDESIAPLASHSRRHSFSTRSTRMSQPSVTLQ